MHITILTGDGSRCRAVQPGQTLLEALQGTKGLSAPCGGQGTCGKCTVYLAEAEGETAVLACQTRVRDGMTVRVPTQAPLAVALESTAQGGFRPDPGLAGYGIACDIGTTTVVCQLVELSTGKPLAVLGQGNAQRSCGGDVISRIRAAMDGRLSALTVAIRGQLAEMIQSLCGTAGIPAAEITRMSVAANTTMCHLLDGLDPSGLGAAPFTPVSRFGDCRPAGALGLPFDGEAYLAPAVSGYVGGDITADLLAVGADRAEAPVLLIDVGTNGEMALGYGDRFVCCSTAAGPAFEGAQLTCGMTAAPGAISAVEWVDGRLSCTVIGGGEAVGLCGSGLLDAAAVMLDLGAVDETGRMLDVEEDDIPAEAAPYLFLTEDDEPAFRLSARVYVTQGDVRKLQLGKGAIAAGVQVLIREYGIGEGGICRLLLAGGFGSCLRPESAARIGLIPQSLLGAAEAVGNAAVEGARMALCSNEAQERLLALRDQMDYRELSGMAAFNAAYMDAMMFPESEE